MRINLKKSQFLVLFLILGIGGVSSAYAITITLDGTTIVTDTITADQFIGATNIVTGLFGSATGGVGNTASGDASTVGGGSGNTASGVASTVGGGLLSFAIGDASTISGGQSNGAIGTSATVGGGTGNNADGEHSTIPGGNNNEATGAYSFAAGRQAKAIHAGATVFADSTSAAYSSTADDQFSIKASGGVRMDVSGGTVSVDGIIECDNCILGFYRVQGDLTSSANVASIICDDGDIVTGGGGTSIGDLQSSLPIPGVEGWQVSNDVFGLEINAIAICADYAPAHVP